jgi:hypothetical protein
VVATSTRQQGNRLIEPEGSSFASLISLGFELNTCSQNQGSHCILPFGARLAVADNLVEFLNEHCPNG